MRSVEIKFSPFDFVLLLRFFWPDSNRRLSNTSKCACRAGWNDATRSRRARNRGVNHRTPSQPRTSFKLSIEAFLFFFLFLLFSPCPSRRRPRRRP